MKVGTEKCVPRLPILSAPLNGQPHKADKTLTTSTKKASLTENTNNQTDNNKSNA